MNKFAIKESDRIKSSKRGHRAVMVQHLIEGGYYTYAQIGERLGISKPDAERLYQNAKRRGCWPITWGEIK